MMASKSKKFFKRVGYTFLVLIMLALIAGFFGIRKFNNTFFKVEPNYLVYTFESKPIHFNWVSDSIGNHFEAQAAMSIPVKIEGLSHKLSMQFDTGSPHTFVYENDLKSLKNIGVNFKEIKKGDARYIQNIEFILGGNHINASMIRILVNYGNKFNKNDTINEISIGTIGSDFMDKHITTIDFKNQNLQFYNDRPQWMTSLPNFQSFNYKGRRFMLPATINGKKLELFYDSGTSAFGLITTKNQFDNYTDKSIEEFKFDANSWGNSVPIRHKRTNKIMELGNTSLNLKRVSYVDMYANYQGLITPFTRIGGWLGNRPFTESVLILDTKKEEFIVTKSSINK